MASLGKHTGQMASGTNPLLAALSTIYSFLQAISQRARRRGGGFPEAWCTTEFYPISHSERAQPAPKKSANTQLLRRISNGFSLQAGSGQPRATAGSWVQFPGGSSDHY